jgi:large subunit ribosomal protein L17
MAVIEFVERNADAKGQDSGPSADTAEQQAAA